MLSIILLVIITGVVVAYFYEDEVENLVVSKLNQNLLTEISVDDINFSVLRKFPNASLEFKNVLIKSSKGFNKKDFNENTDTLCFAKKLFLEFNIKDIIKKKYNIQKVNLKNGEINLYIDKAGNENYLFWNSSSDDESSSNLDLNKVELDDVKIKHINKIKELNYKTQILNAILSGNFSEKVFDLSLNVKTQKNILKIENIEYLKERYLNAKISLKVDEQKTKINKGNLDIDGIKFDVTGEFSNEINLDIKGKEINIKSFLSLLPRDLIKEIDDFKSDGLFYIDCNISGKIDKRNTPHINAMFGIENANVRYVSEAIDLENVNLEGVYSNGSKNRAETSMLKLKKLSAKYNKSTFKGEYAIENFKKPKIVLNINAIAELNDIKELINSDTIEILDGKIQADFKYQGYQKNIDKLTESDFRYAKTQGFIRLLNANLKLVDNEMEYKNINGKCSFKNSDLFVDSLSLNIDVNDFYVRGWVKNIFPFLLFDNNVLSVNANVESKNIDIDYFINAFESENETNPTTKTNSNIVLDAFLVADNIKTDKFIANNLKGNFHYNNKKLIANNLSFNSMSGSITGEALFAELENGNYLLKSNANLKQIDITTLFNTFNNFSQDFILAENLKGKISGNVNYSSEWNSDFDFIENTVKAESSVKIEDGELINFEPMEELSSYIELEELKHIKFSKLENDIYIKDRVVTIPTMDIYSTAFNISASGTHNFDNQFEYVVKVLLSDVLSKKAKKAKKENEEFGVVEDDGLGKTSIYLRIYGNPDDYKVVYDTKKVKEHIKESINEEKTNLKKILNEEFGWFKKDSTVIKSKQDTVNIFDKKYNIVWDESKEEVEAPDDDE